MSKLFLTSKTFIRSFLLGLSVFLIGFGVFTSIQVNEFWEQNKRLNRPVNRQSYVTVVKALPTLLKSFCYDWPQRYLTTDLSTMPEDNRLPIADLYLSEEKIGLLNSNLPTSGANYVKGGILKYDSSTYKVQLHYRGDLWYHWGTDQKSWRVKFKKGELINGMRRVNIINPGPDMISDHVTYLMAAEAGVLAPQSQLVQFRLNEKNFGVMHWCDQINEDFLRWNNLLPGNVYAGEGNVEKLK